MFYKVITIFKFCIKDDLCCDLKSISFKNKTKLNNNFYIYEYLK